MKRTPEHRHDSAFPPGEDPKADALAEAELVARIRVGDEWACAALVRRYGDRMLAVARHRLRCEEDSADAVQDAFLSAFHSLETFAGRSSLGTWLHRIVANACLMKLRWQSRRRDVPMAGPLPAGDESNSFRPDRAGAENAAAIVVREETRAQVRACINRLPEAYRSVVLLHDIEELDTDQTARHLGISANAVRTRLHRARQALRGLLEPIVLDE